jgi:hypothetical protein
MNQMRKFQAASLKLGAYLRFTDEKKHKEEQQKNALE